MSCMRTFKRLRDQLNLTQKELADFLKIDHSSVCCYELGKREPSVPTCKKVIKFAARKGILLSIHDLRTGIHR